MSIPAALVLALSLSAATTSPGSLLARYRVLEPDLASSPFGRPLFLESVEREGKVSGDVFALLQHSFRQVQSELDTPGEWCEVLILHLNVKQCNAGPGTVQLVVGRKQAGAGDGAYSIDFDFAVRESTAGHFYITLEAARGPFGTHAYRLALEVIPLASGQSFLRLSYSYGYGAAASLAMGAYLRTLGKDKVGFTPVGRTPDGEPLYVGGLRGTLERNTMRYFLAIDTYLDSGAEAPASREQWRWAAWYAATERYPRQLHELSRAEYLALKTP